MKLHIVAVSKNGGGEGHASKVGELSCQTPHVHVHHVKSHAVDVFARRLLGRGRQGRQSFRYSIQGEQVKLFLFDYCNSEVQGTRWMHSSRKGSSRTLVDLKRA